MTGNTGNRPVTNKLMLGIKKAFPLKKRSGQQPPNGINVANNAVNVDHGIFIRVVF